MERVQYQQEQMLNELKDLVNKHLFTEKEVKQIVKKRTAFETALVRRVGKKADFLRYASYEMGLEQLRRKRAARIKSESTVPSISDYALVRRQFHIFERAIRKFKADVGLWIQYIQVAQREGARALVGRISARALQLHPTQPSLYIIAASHELNHQSPSSARSLLQRGIRLNDESIELWREYVKMELGFIESLRRRWEVLGIGSTKKPSTQGTKNTETAADPSNFIIPGIEDEMSAPAEEAQQEEPEGVDARKEILEGAIVKSVMDNAVKGENPVLALPKLELFETLKNLLTEYPVPPTVRTTLLGHLYHLSKERLHDDAGAIKFRAGRFLPPDLKGEELVEGLRQANEELLGAACARNAPKEILEMYALFIEEWCGAAIDKHMKQYLVTTLRSACKQKREAGAAEPLLAAHVRVLMSAWNEENDGGPEKEGNQARYA
ncbi:hypothetical protein H0H93_007941 [Arthromyces matolae]|nr:hypothetical protein H0H93_007941 [Arthromyces matolae]